MDTMKKLHESFLLLCGRAHVVHTALQNAKEDYLSFRRRVLGDPSDIFAAQRRVGTPVGAGAAAAKATSATPLHARRGVGPSPFGGTLILPSFHDCWRKNNVVVRSVSGFSLIGSIHFNSLWSFG